MTTPVDAFPSILIFSILHAQMQLRPPGTLSSPGAFRGRCAPRSPVTAVARTSSLVHQAANAAYELFPGLTWMQYPSFRKGGNGYFQLPLSGSTRPLTVSCLPAAKLLLSPWNRRDRVSKQVAPVPRLPDWKLLPSATLNTTGLLQRPPHGRSTCGAQ